MRHRYLLSALAALFAGTAARGVEPSDLKPGLVAAHLPQHKGPPPPPVVRLEPTVALALKAGETPHPKLDGFQGATWKGYINITRPGKYAFSANVLNGTLRVKVGGKEVLTCTADAKPAEVKAATADLDGGVQPFEATFVTAGGDCRVELSWQGPGFVKEPLPHQFLGHLAKDRPAAFTEQALEDRGRLKFEELACVRCHKPAAADKMAKTLADRPGPNLTEVAKRAYAGWIDSWLADPAKHRPNTSMPKLFTDDDRGAAERYAVTRYLVSLAGGTALPPYRAPLPVPDGDKQSADRGRVLYTVAGCAACHQEAKPVKKNEEDDREPLKPEDLFHGPVTKYVLGSPGSKFRPETLAAFLRDPLKFAPAGRMPNMNLNPQEATDLARYLSRLTDETTKPEMPAAPKATPAELLAALPRVNGDKPDDGFEKLPADKQWAAVGAKLFQAKGCGNCHSVDPSGKAGQGQGFASLDKVKAAGEKGCVSEKPDPAKAPVYKLADDERAALAAFLKTGLAGAGTPAPTFQARAAFQRFNCLNCHSRDGQGGIPTDLADQMKVLEKAENADDVRPPVLTGIGHKTRTSWLKSVLTAGGRARPWMQLRMPQYGEANVGFLPESLAALEGTTPDDTVHKVELDTQKVGLGRQIVGKGGLGCISCHDINGIPNTGTRGPDLATINQRVRYDWYERWMHQPLRMAPGTRMPQAFVDGKSTLSTVLNGDPKRQAEAMWAYLSLGMGLPLPDGLEPPKGLIVAVKDRPEVLRTFMPDAGSKAIAVGYPGGVSLAFAADQCRLAYSWAGNFLDASPVWNNRGGAPAKLLGPKFWSSVGGHPWGLTVNGHIPPDFLARANNPAFGLPLPLEPARMYDGPMAVHFDGYTLDKDGRPTFRYHLTENPTDGVLRVAETPAPMRTTAATGFTRRFALEAPAGYHAWLLAGQATKEPRVVAANGGAAPALDLKADEPTVSAAGTRVVLPQDGDRAVVLEALNEPAGAAWRFVPRPGGGWLALVRLPATKEPWKGTFDLSLWALPKDEPALLKDLAAQ